MKRYGTDAFGNDTTIGNDGIRPLNVFKTPRLATPATQMNIPGGANQYVQNTGLVSSISSQIQRQHTPGGSLAQRILNGQGGNRQSRDTVDTSALRRTINAGETSPSSNYANGYNTVVLRPPRELPEITGIPGPQDIIFGVKPSVLDTQRISTHPFSSLADITPTSCFTLASLNYYLALIQPRLPDDARHPVPPEHPPNYRQLLQRPASGTRAADSRVDSIGTANGAAHQNATGNDQATALTNDTGLVSCFDAYADPAELMERIFVFGVVNDEATIDGFRNGIGGDGTDHLAVRASGKQHGLRSCGVVLSGRARVKNVWGPAAPVCANLFYILRPVPLPSYYSVRGSTGDNAPTRLTIDDDRLERMATHPFQLMPYVSMSSTPPAEALTYRLPSGGYARAPFKHVATVNKGISPDGRDQAARIRNMKSDDQYFETMLASSMPPNDPNDDTWHDDASGCAYGYVDAFLYT